MKTQRQNGFTLIELIIVIVILGILAVTAAPRFIDLNSDANKAAIESVGGAIISASQLVYAKAALQNQTNIQSGNVDLDDDGTNDIETRFGYPSGSRSNGVSKAMGGDFENEWIWSTDFNRTVFYLTRAELTFTSGEYINQVPIVATNCYLTYRPPSSLGDSPTIDYVISGC